MKIYTRTGDKGQTSLFGGQRVSKTHLRVDAYGELDELNSALGCLVAEIQEKEIADWIVQVQKDLFVLGAWISSVEACKNIEQGLPAFKGAREKRTNLDEERVQEIEKNIDQWEEKLQPMQSFILPGGNRVGSGLHLARSICRRAERKIIIAREQGELIPAITIEYVNRLADALFVLARYVNWKAGVEEIPW